MGKAGAVFSDYKECLLELQECGNDFRNIVARMRFVWGRGRFADSWLYGTILAMIVLLFISIT